MLSRNHKCLACASVVAVSLVMSCGGKSTLTESSDAGSIQVNAGDAAGNCRSSATSFSSSQAVAAARCYGWLRPGTALASLGSLALADATGASSAWMVDYVDVASGAVFTGRVYGAGYPRDDSLNPGFYSGVFQCTKPLNADLSSNLFVPDAFARLAPHGVDKTAVMRIVFSEQGECPGLWSQSVKVSFGKGALGAAESGPWWDVHYDATGQFQQVCGPCSGADHGTTCGSCSNP